MTGGQTCGRTKDGEREELKEGELKTEVMINQGGNSGIYFHIAQHPEGWFFDGHEVQVNNTHGDPVKTGSLWGVVKLYDAPVKDNDWFEMHIVVAGQTIDVFINGKRRLTYVEPEGIQGPRKISKGYIALQAHDPGSIVRYRNIRLKKPAADNTNKTSQHLPTAAPGWNIELLAESPGTIDKTLDTISNTGFGWVRQTLYWEPEKFDWAATDRLINSVTENDLQIIAVLTSSNISDQTNKFAQFAYKFADRYSDQVDT